MDRSSWVWGKQHVCAMWQGFVELSASTQQYIQLFRLTVGFFPLLPWKFSSTTPFGFSFAKILEFLCFALQR